MRLIDADVIRAKLIEYIGLTNGFDRAFNETPTIDAVSVVRCKDCKYYKSDVALPNGTKVKCVMGIKPDDFCSYGERMRNGTD